MKPATWRFNPKWIVGKKVSGIVLNKFSNGRGGHTTHPRFYFEDGSSIGFTVEETESSEYGIRVLYCKAPR